MAVAIYAVTLTEKCGPEITFSFVGVMYTLYASAEVYVVMSVL